MNRSEPFSPTQHVDPFLVHQLERMKQKYVTVQTLKHTVRGILASVHSDYIVLHVHSIPFYIQLADIACIRQGSSHIRSM